jgi:hypothetical protein
MRWGDFSSGEYFAGLSGVDEEFGLNFGVYVEVLI